MKKFSVFFLFLFVIKFCIAKHNTTYPSNVVNSIILKERLIVLNSNWKDKNMPSVSFDFSNIQSDNEFIKLHLSLVEQELRAKDISFLSQEQKEKRLHCLDILHSYWGIGVFPQNYYHNKRTPYFIDIHGTYCAVGYLLKETGFDNVAKRINKENNYGYLPDLAIKYKEIGLWSKEYGFSLDELAWIQPAYNPTYCLPFSNYTNGYDTLIKRPCKSDGYIKLPHPSTWCAQFPVTATICSQEYFTNPDSLPSGVYTISVLDANNNGAFYQIELKDSLKVFLHQEFLTCTPTKLFSISVDSVLDGQSPFLYGVQDGFNNFVLQQSSLLDSLNWWSAINTNPGLLYVQDANGCFAREPYYPNQDFGSLWAFSRSFPSSCLDSCSGSIVIDSVWGSNGPSSFFKLVNGNWVLTNSSVIDSLCLGANTFKVQDSLGCYNIHYGNIQMGSPQNYFQLSISQSNIPLCNGDPVNLNISINGGIPPYTQQVQNYTDFKKVTIIDSLGCRKDSMFHIVQPTSLQIKDSIISQICGNLPGVINIDGIGGTPPYLSGVGNFPLNAGANSFYISDANGCGVSKSIYKVIKPVTLVDSLVQPAWCSLDSAIVQLKVCGPFHPYIGAGFHTLPVGTNVLTVQGSDGCIFHDTIIVSTSSTLSLNINVLNQIKCFGDSALVEVIPSGGTPPYIGSGQFLYSHGNHIISITDSHNCTMDTVITISSPTALSSTVTGYPDNGLGQGSAKCNVTGGTPPYTFLWSNNTTLDSTFGLISGWHYVTIKDSNNCVLTDSVFIPLVFPNGVESPLIGNVTLFPNPTSSNVILSYQTKDNGVFTLYNSVGQVVLKTELSKLNTKAQISLIDVASGAYQYEIDFGKKFKSHGILSIIK